MNQFRPKTKKKNHVKPSPLDILPQSKDPFASGPGRSPEKEPFSLIRNAAFPPSLERWESDVQPEKEVQELLRRVQKAASPHRLILVGGGVRDLELGGEPQDFDLLVENLPLRKLQRQLRAKGLFGAMGGRMQVMHLQYNGVVIQLIGYQTSKEHTLEQELITRDFTINTLCRAVLNSGKLHPEIIGARGSRAHLRDHVLSCPGDAVDNLRSAPRHTLRALKFISRQGMTPSRELEAAFAEGSKNIPPITSAPGTGAHRLNQELGLSAESRWQIFESLLSGEHHVRALQIGANYGLLRHFGVHPSWEAGESIKEKELSQTPYQVLLQLLMPRDPQSVGDIERAEEVSKRASWLHLRSALADQLSAAAYTWNWPERTTERMWQHHAVTRKESWEWREHHYGKAQPPAALPGQKQLELGSLMRGTEFTKHGTEGFEIAHQQRILRWMLAATAEEHTLGLQQELLQGIRKRQKTNGN